MSKTFDELYDEFLKNIRIDKNELSEDDSVTNNFFDIERTEKLLEKIGDSNMIDEELTKTLDDSLGEPHKIEQYTEGGLYYEKRIWNTPKGDFVKVIIRDEPINMVPSIDEQLEKTPSLDEQLEKTPSLDEQLEKALAIEDYETASVIRDLINAERKNN